MDDLKNHEHGDEGVGSTHSTCNKHNIGGKSVCCECSGKTDCSDVPMTPQWIEEFDKEFGNLFDGEESIYEEVKHFIQKTLTQQLEEVVGCLPEKWSDKLHGEGILYQEGYNDCRKDFLEKLKSLQTNEPQE